MLRPSEERLQGFGFELLGRLHLARGDPGLLLGRLGREWRPLFCLRGLLSGLRLGRCHPRLFRFLRSGEGNQARLFAGCCSGSVPGGRRETRGILARSSSANPVSAFFSVFLRAGHRPASGDVKRPERCNLVLMSPYPIAYSIGATPAPILPVRSNSSGVLPPNSARVASSPTRDCIPTQISCSLPTESPGIALLGPTTSPNVVPRRPPVSSGVPGVGGV